MWRTEAVMVFILMLSGCHTGPGNGRMVSSGPASAHGQLYVSTSNSILRFSDAENAAGNVAPAGVIRGADTQLSAPQHIFMDIADDRLYVANQGGSSVLVFDKVSTLNGDVSPTRVISGSSTLLSAPFDVAVDLANNLLYVADGISILVFAGASTVNGDAPPVRNVTINFTVGGMLLDAANNQLYLSGPGINVVQRLDGISSQNGAASVGGAISGPNTRLAQPRGVALDASGRLIVGNSASPASLTIYANASTANGGVLPSAEIMGANSGLQFPEQIALNREAGGGELFVVDSLRGGVLVFIQMATANGDVAPERIISGPATGIIPNAATGIAIDTSR
jgi:hypothetical protein